MTRLAVWSIGNHAIRNLLPAAAAAADIQLVGILSRNEQVVAEQCARYGCRTWRAPEEMLADHSVDTVMIAGPNSVHFDQGLQVLTAGKHLWCEKTLTPSLGETETLAQLAGDNGLVLAEAFMFAHHPQFAAVRGLLERAEMGKLVSISSRFGFPHLPKTDIRYSKSLAGGALLDAGAYCIAAPLLLLNDDLDGVEGHTSTPPEFEVDTLGFAVLRFHSGVAALCDWGFGRGYRNEMDLWFEGAFVRVDRAFSKPPVLDTTVELFLQRNNERRTIAIPGGVNHFSRMMEHFSEAARKEELRRALSEQALRQARVLGALRSQNAGSVN